MDSFEITKETLAIIPISNKTCKVIELYGEYIVNKAALDVLDDSCRYFGSSYEGRFEGTKRLIGVSYKSPIVLEENNIVVFFPTTSPRLKECAWINSTLIKSINRKNYVSEIIFNNDRVLELEINYPVLQNQVLRAARLESVFRKRKEV